MSFHDMINRTPASKKKIEKELKPVISMHDIPLSVYHDVLAVAEYLQETHFIEITPENEDIMLVEIYNTKFVNK